MIHIIQCIIYIKCIKSDNRNVSTPSGSVETHVLGRNHRSEIDRSIDVLAVGIFSGHTIFF